MPRRSSMPHKYRVQPGDHVSSRGGGPMMAWTQITPNPTDGSGRWSMAGKNVQLDAASALVVWASLKQGSTHDSWAVLIFIDDRLFWTWSHSVRVLS